MDVKKRVMTTNPLNAEPPIEDLRSWITPNKSFFNRNQGAIPDEKIDINQWVLTIVGEIDRPLDLTFTKILEMPKATVINTLECSGNGRSLLKEKAPGNPWTIGGVGNVVWGGVWLRDILLQTGLKPTAKHVAFEGFGKPVGGSGVDFIRSIPIEKALQSTMLVYEMNGEPLPNEHGYPMRVLPLGWYGANSVKWLNRIVVMDRPYEGYFMDKAYRIFQKGQDPKSGEVVTNIHVKSIITKPLTKEKLKKGKNLILGMAYAGETDIAKVEISIDEGSHWIEVDYISPKIKYSWLQWQYIWDAQKVGSFTILSRASDVLGNVQPMQGIYNAHGYCNNGILD
ncbi:MAG: molybdopterin-dependent oxidoreductase, partial [Thermodesulfovibrionales bacterium]